MLSGPAWAGLCVITSWLVQQVLPVLSLLAWPLVLWLLASQHSRPLSQPITLLLQCQCSYMKTNCSFVFSVVCGCIVAHTKNMSTFGKIDVWGLCRATGAALWCVAYCTDRLIAAGPLSVDSRSNITASPSLRVSMPAA